MSITLQAVSARLAFILVALMLSSLSSSSSTINVNVAVMAPMNSNKEGVDVSISRAVPAIACAMDKINDEAMLPDVNLT